ncbi:ABC transporter ATP-binding protein [Saccharospirillum sp.]|uniref:ABC transporter ATP-binding protein n=1 Tax=Saccharospirillum sp. TaxID=2033801 RepID=UPI003299BD0F
MLRVKGLSVQFTTRFGAETAVEDVDLTVKPGEIHGLVGESGAGKSTIGAAIMGLLPGASKVTAGSVHLGDTDLLTLSPAQRHRVRGKRISMIFQDPQTSLNPLMTVEEQLLETMLTHDDMPIKKARVKAIDLLSELGIERAEQRIKAYPHQFSGGMRQRVVIALALCTNPELIVADEPTTALDVAVQSQVLDLLRTLAVKRQVGIILITHDIGVIAQVSDQVTVLRHGKVVESGLTVQVLGDPQQPYTQGLMASVPRLQERMHRFPMMVAAESDRSIDTQSGSLPAGVSADYAADWLQQRPNQVKNQTAMSLDLSGLDVCFTEPRQRLFQRPDTLYALKQVSIEVPEGTVMGLVGESGSGKSTLAKAIVGLVNPSRGEIRFQGEVLAPGVRRKRRDPSRRLIQMVFQDPYSSLNNRRKIGDILAEPLIVYGIEKNATERRRLAASFLELVGLPAASIHRYPHQFSGGQRQRIAVARALIARPDLLICDEPTSALDVSIQAQILNLLKDLQERFSLTILFISHNLAVVRQMSDRIMVLKNGEVVETGSSEAFFNAPQHPYSKELLALTPSLDTVASS